MAIRKVSREWICLLLVTFYLAAMGFLDWDSFFPLQAHTDLGFQVVGEALELLVIACCLGTVLWTVGLFRKDSRLRRPTIARRFLIGCAMTVFFIAPSWRDFFPGDIFQYSAGAHHFLSAAIGGAFLGAFVTPTLRQTAGTEPVSEVEASAV